jgi:hypothetical protein
MPESKILQFFKGYSDLFTNVGKNVVCPLLQKKGLRMIHVQNNDRLKNNMAIPSLTNDTQLEKLMSHYFFTRPQISKLTLPFFPRAPLVRM